MTEHSFTKFEVTKYNLRQSKDGVILAFVVHPSDVTSELLSAPIGTRMLMALAEIEPESIIGNFEASNETQP